MTKAAHFICKPDGRSLRNLEHLGNGRYRSWAWIMAPSNAEALVNGFIYLHTAKANGARIGGRVLQAELVERHEAKRLDGYAFTFQVMPEARDVRWRGQSTSLAHASGLVEADLAYELV